MVSLVVLLRSLCPILISGAIVLVFSSPVPMSLWCTEGANNELWHINYGIYIN